MIQVSVKKLDALTNQATFDTLEEAQAWVAQQESEKAFGMPAHDITIPAVWSFTEEEKDEEGNVIKEAESFILEPEMTTHYEADYTVEYVDISESIGAEKRKARATRLQLAGIDVISEIYVINEGKRLTADQFNAIFESPALQKIERLVRQGSFSTARYFIKQLDNTFYTEEEKNKIIAIITKAMNEG